MLACLVDSDSSLCREMVVSGIRMRMVKEL